ncbi:MAG: HD domain-containing phosphohydrolase [Bacteriovoracaceae bacterium]
MALKVMLVDPNETWLEEAEKYFSSIHYDVSTAINGKEAQLNLYNENYFSLIINYATSSHSAIQVLKFCQKNKKKVKTVLIFNTQEEFDECGFDEKGLKKIGAMEIVIKPVEFPDISGLLEDHQDLSDFLSNLQVRDTVSEEEEVSCVDNDFTQVRIDQFYSSKAVLFDIYIKLAKNKYLKILHAGDKFDKERLDRYKNDKNIEYLFFHTKDRRKFIQFSNLVAGKTVTSKKVGADRKMGLLKNLSEKYTEEVFTQGVKPQIIEEGRQVCEHIYNFIEKEEDLYKLLKSYHDFDPEAVEHSFLVTLYTSAIIKQFEWQSKTTIETAAMACMLHDIGKMELPQELVKMRPKDMNEDQLKKYQLHPEIGAQIVDNNSLINKSVKQIIYQHHENFDGTGYPHNIKGVKILTLANIIHLADDFAHMMIDQKLKPTEALKAIITDSKMVKRYNSVIIENFIKAFVDPKKLTKEKALPTNSRVVPQRKVS